MNMTLLPSRVQGQIKTGAPCRSERLAKYNQVRDQLWRHPAAARGQLRACACVRVLMTVLVVVGSYCE